MVRDPDPVLAEHRQQQATSEASSLIELMLKLLGVDVPDYLQHYDESPSQHWRGLVDQVFGRYAIRRFGWDGADFGALLKAELTAGRPVGLILKNAFTGDGPTGRRAWAAMRVSEVQPYLFVDVASKMPELGGGEGHFTEKRVLRVDTLLTGAVAEVLYCEELIAALPVARRGRRPACLSSSLTR